MRYKHGTYAEVRERKGLYEKRAPQSGGQNGNQDNEPCMLIVDEAGNATFVNISMHVDADGNATLSGATLTVDRNGNATIA